MDVNVLPSINKGSFLSFPFFPNFPIHGLKNSCILLQLNSQHTVKFSFKSITVITVIIMENRLHPHITEH